MLYYIFLLKSNMDYEFILEHAFCTVPYEKYYDIINSYFGEAVVDMVRSHISGLHQTDISILFNKTNQKMVEFIKSDGHVIYYDSDNFWNIRIIEYYNLYKDPPLNMELIRQKEIIMPIKTKYDYPNIPWTWPNLTKEQEYFRYLAINRKEY